MSPVLNPKSEFLRRYLMSRLSFNPRDFGADLDKDAFMDQMVDDFNEFTKGEMSLDELLLRPRLALGFCEFSRSKHRFWDAPDDIILRSVMQRRKNPNA